MSLSKSELRALVAGQGRARRAAPLPARPASAPALARLVIAGLPVPPSLNNAYTTGRGHGRRVLSEEGRAYKAQAGRLIAHAAAAEGFQVPPRAPLRLGLRFWFARNNRDGSNAVKLLEDAAAEVLGVDDRYVVAMTWEKAIDAAAPRCDLTIELLEAA